jgi:hypothetical protein
MKADQIINRIHSIPYHQQRYELMMPNCYYQPDSEADMLGIRKSGLCDEFEVKVSRSDFLADKRKYVAFRKSTADDYKAIRREKPGLDHSVEPWCMPKYDALRQGHLAINYFWYVVLEGVCDASDIPEFAGLIIVLDEFRHRVIREPDRLHRNKMSFEDRYKIARKANYRYWDLRGKQ